MVAYAKTQLDKIVTDQGMDAVLAALKADPTRVTLNVWVGKRLLDDAAKAIPKSRRMRSSITRAPQPIQDRVASIRKPAIA